MQLTHIQLLLAVPASMLHPPNQRRGGVALSDLWSPQGPPPGSGPITRQQQILLDLLALLRPAQLSSEQLLRLLLPFHAKIDPHGSPQPQAIGDARQQIQPVLLRLGMNPVSLPAAPASQASLPANGHPEQMIGDKNPIQLNSAGSPTVRPTAAAAPLQGLSQSLAVNQILNAQVLEQSPSGQLRLLLGSQVLRANLADLPRLNPGDQLSLQLVSQQQPPQFKVVAIQRQYTPEMHLLRQLLPKQGSLQQLFQLLEQRGEPSARPLTASGQGLSSSNPSPASLARLAVSPLPQPASANPAQPAGINPAELSSSPLGSKLSPPLRELVELLTRQTLQPQRLSPELVRSLVLASGLFLEANLARRRDQPSDLKSALLRMVSLLRSGVDAPQPGLMGQIYSRLMQGERGKAAQPPPADRPQQLLAQLRGAAEAALAKVEVRQLHSLQQSDENRQTWQLTLPMIDQQQRKDLDIRIQREKAKGQQQGQEQWTVELHFDFDASGPIDVRLNLKQETLGVVFWSQWPETHKRVGQLLPKLQQSLERIGLQVGQLNAFAGIAPKPPEESSSVTGLLNLTA